MSEILNQKLALLVYFVGQPILAAAAFQAALFESCNCPIMGLGLFGKNLKCPHFQENPLE